MAGHAGVAVLLLALADFLFGFVRIFIWAAKNPMSQCFSSPLSVPRSWLRAAPCRGCSTAKPVVRLIVDDVDHRRGLLSKFEGDPAGQPEAGSARHPLRRQRLSRVEVRASTCGPRFTESCPSADSRVNTCDLVLWSSSGRMTFVSVNSEHVLDFGTRLESLRGDFSVTDSTSSPSVSAWRKLAMAAVSFSGSVRPSTYPLDREGSKR